MVYVGSVILITLQKSSKQVERKIRNFTVILIRIKGCEACQYLQM